MWTGHDTLEEFVVKTEYVKSLLTESAWTDGKYKKETFTALKQTDVRAEQEWTEYAKISYESSSKGFILELRGGGQKRATAAEVKKIKTLQGAVNLCLPLAARWRNTN